MSGIARGETQAGIVGLAVGRKTRRNLMSVSDSLKEF